VNSVNNEPRILLTRAFYKISENFSINEIESFSLLLQFMLQLYSCFSNPRLVKKLSRPQMTAYENLLIVENIILFKNFASA